MMRVAIMQPTYLPWIGYFGMIDQVDTFILLDSVQFARRSWQQRNQIKTANGPIWLTVPIASKGKRDQLINEVGIDSTGDFPATHIASLQHNYRKAPYYGEYAPKLFSLLNQSHAKLADLTGELIAWFCRILGISTPIQNSSTMENRGSKAELLAMLCGQIDAAEYLCAPGSRDYMEATDAFTRHGISVRYHDYDHPQYLQLYGDFTAQMSIVDLLFNVGPESLAVIREGYRGWQSD